MAEQTPNAGARLDLGCVQHSLARFGKRQSHPVWGRDLMSGGDSTIRTKK